MNSKIDILGTKIDNLSLNSALDRVYTFLDQNDSKKIYTPNSEILMLAKNDDMLKKILNSADMLVADGSGVVLASRILKTPLPERVAGFDLVTKIFESCSTRNIKFFFFGASPGVAEIAKNKITDKYIGVEVVGIRSGYFNKSSEADIINTINSSHAEILLVALGAPKQEIWIYENLSKLNVKICIGIGGSFDVFAGVVSRAPLFFQKNGSEWLYRLYKEPWRYKRMLLLPKFILHAIWERLKNNRE